MLTVIIGADGCGARYETEPPPLSTTQRLTETIQNTQYVYMQIEKVKLFCQSEEKWTLKT